MDHVLQLAVIRSAHAGIGFVDLVGHVVVERGQKIVMGGACVEQTETSGEGRKKSPVPVIGDVGRLQWLPDGRLCTPEVARDGPPVPAEKLGTVGEEGNIGNLRVPAAYNFPGDSRDGKGSGGISGNQKLVRIREEILAYGKRCVHVGGPVTVENLRLAFLIGIRNLTVSDVKITGCIRDDKEIPVTEGIARGIRIRDSDVDVHDLRKGTQIVPVEIRFPCSDTRTGYRPCGCEIIPCNASSGEENNKVCRAALSQVAVEF